MWVDSTPRMEEKEAWSSSPNVADIARKDRYVTQRVEQGGEVIYSIVEFRSKGSTIPFYTVGLVDKQPTV
jgi:hypothetical protein